MKAPKWHTFLCIIFLLFLILLVNSCVTTSFMVSPNLPRQDKSQKILLLPMDIQLSTLTAGGVLKPEAEWTEKANEYVEKAIRAKVNEMGIRLLYVEDFEDIELNTEEEEEQNQLIKLHEAVGQSILKHQYMVKLPGKKNFDWSIGPKANFLKEKYGADYSMVIYLRDSYASGGRVAAFIVAAALGYQMQLGQQVGFASLIDLETGNVFWFNRLAREVGDLRTEKAASDSVEILLSDLPE